MTAILPRCPRQRSGSPYLPAGNRARTTAYESARRGGVRSRPEFGIQELRALDRSKQRIDAVSVRVVHARRDEDIVQPSVCAGTLGRCVRQRCVLGSASGTRLPPRALPGVLPAYAGPLMLEEIAALCAVLEKAGDGRQTLVGGAKVSSKISILKHLASKVDKLIIGGGMANTFLLSHGVDHRQVAGRAGLRRHGTRDHDRRPRPRGCAVVLPEDVVIAREVQVRCGARTSCRSLAVPSDADDPRRRTEDGRPLCRRAGRAAETLLWNGPLGAFEVAPFGDGTFTLAREAARLTKEGKLITVAGGGDTVAALNAAGVTARFHLRLDSGRRLPRMARGARAAGRGRAPARASPSSARQRK